MNVEKLLEFHKNSSSCDVQLDTELNLMQYRRSETGARL